MLTGMKKLQLTGLLEREGDGYVSLCPELDIASQGDTVEQAFANLREAVELFLETAAGALKQLATGEQGMGFGLVHSDPIALGQSKAPSSLRSAGALHKRAIWSAAAKR